MSDFLYKEFDTLSSYGKIPDKKYPFVEDNLNPHLALRAYQKEALNRFYFYYEGDKKPSNNVHLAYQMATGSGKTVVMAGLMLYLYQKGYRNFLFFVNRSQIVEKTKDNFLNPQSSKYLFNQKIFINQKRVNIKAVDNFAYGNDDDINICFTTIQGLFQDFHTEKENSLTLEDFKDNKIVLLADEAHHINVSTKNNQLELFEKAEKPSWENTVEKIFQKYPDNILLEFTATMELANKAVQKKYKNKLLYNYDIKSFISDNFSKGIKLFKSDTDKETRILQALIISLYREQVAIKHKLNIKPVVLFKSTKIEESKHNQELFNNLLDKLTPPDLEKIKQTSEEKKIEIINQSFAFFAKQNISMDLLATKIKISFSKEKCLCTNNDRELEENQKKLNSLEDKNNPIRGIFTVDKLNEGWDVLNLFDIVRLYEGQATGGRNQGKIAKKTIQEAQLIGRGARYCPFKIKQEDDLYTRKFDDDITSELRVLEELYFHSRNEHRYISEIKRALEELGWFEEDEQTMLFELKLKDKYREDNTFKEKLIFANKREENNYHYAKDIEKFGIKKRNFRYELASGKGVLLDVFNEVNDTNNQNNKRVKEYNITSFLGENIIKNALLKFPTFTFNNLKKYLPRLTSTSDFLDDGYLAEFNIDLKGDAEGVSLHQKFNIALAFLSAFEKELKGNITEYKGTKEFYPRQIIQVFKDKTLRIPQEKEKTIQEIVEDFFVFQKFYGTSEEKELINLISKIITEINEKHQNVYLIRNERHVALYDFKEGRKFYPDFIMLSKKDKCHYQFFIEPKGRYLQGYDKWKEGFLLEIENNCHAYKNINSTITYTNNKYKIIGLAFYEHQDENSFKDNLLKKLG